MKDERTGVNDGTAQLYPDVEAVWCQGKNIVYLRPQAAGTPDEARAIKQPQQAPPEKESIWKKLWEYDAEAKRRNDARRQEPRHRSYDYDRGR